MKTLPEHISLVYLGGCNCSGDAPTAFCTISYTSTSITSPTFGTPFQRPMSTFPEASHFRRRHLSKALWMLLTNGATPQ